MALIGWQIDRWLGTSPLMLLVLFVFTVGYVSWKQYVAYDAKMRRQEQSIVGLRNGRQQP